MSQPTAPASRLAFNLSTGADTGGAAIREVEAFRNLEPTSGLKPAWQVRAMVAATNYIEYPEDIPWSQLSLEQWYDKADVVHLNHTLHGHRWYDDGQGKPIVLEHHGLHKGSFDVDFESSITQGLAIGAVQIGSTVNLELFGPPNSIEWAPIPYNLHQMRKLRAQMVRKHTKAVQNSPKRSNWPWSESKAIRIGHAPTVRSVKSTDIFIAAMTSLKRRGFNVEAVLIEKKSHSECLERKATCDILVDQLKLGYGCNAIEAWAMGIPVVGGVTNASWREYMQSRFKLTESPTGLPFYEASEASLEDTLVTLIADADLRDQWTKIGTAHVERWHSQEFSVRQMSRIYASAKRTTPGGGPLSRRIGHHKLNHQERIIQLRAARASRVHQR